MNAEAQQEHQWLKKFVGEWTCESECVTAPGEPAMKMKGEEVVRAVGDLWILGEGHGEMPGGGTAHSILTLGFDPCRKKYVGTWVGSMMTHMWIYEGSLDEGKRKLILDTEGPDMASPEKTLKYREEIELVDDNHRVWSSYTAGPNGSWQRFMSMHLRRKGR